MKKKYLMLLSTMTAAVIIGCGEGSSVSDQTFEYDTSSIFGFSKEVTYKNYLVKIDDDPIVGANIKATNCETFKELGNGEYLLEKCIGKPLYVEVKDGEIKDINVTQTFPLLLNISESNKSDNFVVTPLTSILITATEDEINEFATKLGVNREDLFSDSNEIVKKLFPKINTILIASASTGAITNKIKFLDTVRKNILDNIDIETKDINITEVIKKVKSESIQKPSFFGIVVINENDINQSDPLDYLVKLQKSKSIRFYGIVFDGPVTGAKIEVKDLDTNKTYDLNVTSGDSVGEWSIAINSNDELYDIIMNKDHLLQFIASKDKDKLTSTITTKRLRDLIKKTTLISPTENKKLIISNVTTALDAFLDKNASLNSNSYDESVKEIKVYYKDKLLKLAALIKAVVDNNASMDANNTYELAVNSIDENYTINTSKVDVDEEELSTLENNISSNTILSSQLNEVNEYTLNGFENAAKQSNYTFYRLIAYFDNDNFIREYTKIIVYPSYYETQTCYLENNSTSDWYCSTPKIIKDSSNFVLGHYEVSENDLITTYNLEFNSTVEVEDLHKNYDIFGVSKSENNVTSGIIKTTPIVLVNNYDIVDAFRRLPIFDDGEDFRELQDLVRNLTKEEVNYELNRWVKTYINKVNEYFDENATK